MSPDAANRNDLSMVDGTAASPRLGALDRRAAGDIAGSLEWLLPQTAVGHDGLFLYYPRRASLAPKLRAFIDVAKKNLKSPE
jgi:DNA-binding transcriptional LysR family regulator